MGGIIFSKLLDSKIVLGALLLLLVIGNIGLSFAQENSGDGLVITIRTNKHQYSYCETVSIQGLVFNGSTGEPIKTKILIQIFEDENLVYKISTFSSENGSYLDTGYRAYYAGVFNVSASVSSEGNYETASMIIFSNSLESIPEILDAYITPLSMILLSFVYLFIILYYVTREHEDNDKNKGKDKPTSIIWLLKPRMFVATQFIFLSIFTISILCILVFTPVQIGTQSPIGLVQQTYDNSTQWVINIGGIRAIDSTQYLGGVQIPVYVIALSFVGAYVFFLDKVPDLVKEDEIKKLFDSSLKYLVRFFIAPLLAVALYLVLWQIEVRGYFILAAVSFATGLIIEDVTNRILEFARDVLGKKNSKNGNQNVESLNKPGQSGKETIIPNSKKS